MSSSENTPQIVNSFYGFNFLEWQLYTTAVKEDWWHKKVYDPSGHKSGKISIKRTNYEKADRSYSHKYYFYFEGDTYILQQYFNKITEKKEFEFDTIKSAQDFIDTFIEKLNKLTVFF